MKFQSGQTVESIDINLTPLIDVVFLLLIFFMVSTTFDTTSQLKIRLPEASPAETRVESSELTIMIDSKGRFFLNSRALSSQKSAALSLAIQQFMEGRNLPVTIQSDAESPVQSLVTAMDVVGQLGLVEVSIATTRPIE
ncbi:MAG: biopolymer transport protein ExbD [Gammaproteobacteria bacterium]|jgi:biopolymer transport protein ExbD